MNIFEKNSKFRYFLVSISFSVSITAFIIFYDNMILRSISLIMALASSRSIINIMRRGKLSAIKYNSKVDGKSDPRKSYGYTATFIVSFVISVACLIAMYLSIGGAVPVYGIAIFGLVFLTLLFFIFDSRR